MTLQQLKALLDKACLDSYNCGCYDIDEIDEEDAPGLYVVEDDDWTQDGKYQYSSTIVGDGEGNFFCLNNNRSGSYHTDWYYGEPTIQQVARVEEVVTKTVVTWKGI